MKKLLLVTLTFLSLSTFAQSFCGTNPSPEFLDYYYSKDMSYLTEGSRDANAIIYVPIQYHIVGTDSGGGYYSVKDLLAVHCALNDRYAHSQIQFFMYAPPHYIRNTRYYTMSDNNVDRDMKNGNNVSNICNVYIVQNCISSGTSVCGYATFPGFGRQGIVVAKSCSGATSTTLAHEMGHFLGLPHTFSGWEGRTSADPATNSDEFVNGTNCASRGDRFCGTPADFISDRWGCPYIGSKVDFNGDLYNTVLDETLFMSYSSDACQNRFSNDQEAEMNNVRRTSRSSMDAYTVPSVVTPATTTLVSPASGATSVAPFTSLIWNKVSDATHYHVLMSTVPSFNFNNLVDTIVADTTYRLHGINTGTTYYWKILPMTLGATCGTYSTTNSFTTSAFTASLVITEITCPGDINGAINISPSGGTPPYTFNWSNGDAFNPITDLAANNYTVTITDLLGRTMIATIALPDGPTININIFPSGASEITAAATGGNGAPYTYSWSNGSTTPQSSPNAGTVTVTVTDARGCTNTKTISYNGITNYNAATDKHIKVYPNPLVNQDAVVSIEAAIASSATIKLNAIDGSLIYENNVSVSEGENSFIIPTAKLAKGVYTVNIYYLESAKNIRLIVQ